MEKIVWTKSLKRVISLLLLLVMVLSNLPFSAFAEEPPVCDGVHGEDICAAGESCHRYITPDTFCDGMHGGDVCSFGEECYLYTAPATSCDGVHDGDICSFGEECHLYVAPTPVAPIARPTAAEIVTVVFHDNFLDEGTSGVSDKTISQQMAVGTSLNDITTVSLDMTNRYKEISAPQGAFVGWSKKTVVSVDGSNNTSNMLSAVPAAESVET